MSTALNTRLVQRSVNLALWCLLACVAPALAAEDTPDCGCTPFDPTWGNIGDLNVPTDPGMHGALVSYNPIVTSDHPVASIVCNPASPHFFPCASRPATVLVTATDIWGNVTSTSFQVRVFDPEAPVIGDCPDITVSAEFGADGAFVDYHPTATDNCAMGTVTCSPLSGTYFPIGSTLVTVTAQDQARNSSHKTFTVTVEPASLPLNLGTNSDLMVDNELHQDGAFVYFGMPGYSGGNGEVSISSEPASGSFFPIGSTAVIVSAHDSTGQMASSAFMVTVNDTEAPMLGAMDDLTAQAAYGQGGATVSFATPSASDNHKLASVVCLPASGSFFPLGDNLVTVTATDMAGNKANGTFHVLVEQPVAPLSLSGLPDVVVNCGLHLSGANVTFDAPSYQGGNGSVQVVCSPASGSFFPMGSTMVNCTATDGFGQSASGFFMVTVLDAEKPAIVCSVGTAMLKSPNHDMVDVGLSCSASDNAGIASVSFSVSQDESLTDLGSGKFGPDAMLLRSGNGDVIGLRVRSERDGKGDGRVYLLMMTVTDTSGNVSKGMATVTVPKGSSAKELQSVAAQASAAMAAGNALAYDSLVGISTKKNK